MKKISKPLGLTSTPSKPPLEVIKELNGEESISRKPTVQIRGSVEEGKYNGEETYKEIVESLKRREEIKNENKIGGGVTSNTLNNLNNQILQNKNDGLNEWKNFIISNFISEGKILSDSADEILYKGNLEKLVCNNKIYSTIEKFCVVNKTEFKCYKSKEAFLMRQKQSLIIPLKDIISCKRMLLDNNYIQKYPKLKGNFFFFIQLFEEAGSQCDNNCAENTSINQLKAFPELNSKENKEIPQMSYSVRWPLARN